jgi:hypothetical protein
MTEFKIEKGVPMPGGRGRASALLDTLRQMEPGDSLFRASAASGSAVHNVLQYLRRRETGKKWTARKVEGGWRIWRIA